MMMRISRCVRGGSEVCVWRCVCLCSLHCLHACWPFLAQMHIPALNDLGYIHGQVNPAERHRFPDSQSAKENSPPVSALMPSSVMKVKWMLLAYLISLALLPFFVRFAYREWLIGPHFYSETFDGAVTTQSQRDTACSGQGMNSLCWSRRSGPAVSATR